MKAPDTYTVDLAIDIADESEASVIESHCEAVEIGGVSWWDTSDVPACEPEPILRARHYLERRGLIEIHPTEKNLIRIPESHKLGRESLKRFAR